MIDIDYKLLNQETLKSLIAEIVLREGTDYGFQEISHQDKVDQLLRRLKSGVAKIVYCSEDDSCYITENSHTQY